MMEVKSFLKKHSIFFIVTVVSLSLIVAWFRSGKLIATGEESLLFYEPAISVNKFSSSWLDIGLGAPNAAFLPRYPFTLFLLIGNTIAPSWVVQASLYFLLLLAGGYSFYLLARKALNLKGSTGIYLLGALYYILNLYSQMMVWNRFLVPSMFAWAYLPLFLYLWLLLIEKITTRRLLIFVISGILFSNTFTIATYVLTFWVPAGIWGIFYLHQQKSQRFVICKNILITAIVWLAVNIWWLYPFVKVGSSVFSEIFTWQTNFDSLRGVTSITPWWNFLTLYHNGFMKNPDLWGTWYMSRVVITLSVFLFVLLILGTIYLVAKHKLVIPVVGVVSLFIIKGTLPPLGYQFYQWTFEHIPQLGILRNPYEKFGPTWLLIYALLITVGLHVLITLFKPHAHKLFIIFTGLFLIFHVWPMWTGDVYQESVRVQVPEYYTAANEAIGSNKRILMLPLLDGDGAKYEWGYAGLEPSEFLFSSPVISRIFRTKDHDEKYYQLYYAIQNKQDVTRLLQEMGITHVVINNDLHPDYVGKMPFHLVEEMVRSNDTLVHVGSYDSLEVYEFSEKRPIIETTSGVALNVKKLSGDRYRISVMDATEPFTLVFKTTYNPLWTAKIRNEMLPQEKIYDYANAWQVDKTGSYTIDLYFKIWPWQ